MRDAETKEAALDVLLRKLRDAHGEVEKSALTADLLAELGAINDTPFAKAAWRRQ